MTAVARRPVAEAEAADAVAWLRSHLTPIRLLDAGAHSTTRTWQRLDVPVDRLVCDPLGSPGTHDSGLVESTLSVHGGPEELNVTRDPSRSSLLEPNHAVLARHGRAADFEVCERRAVPSVTLGEVAANRGPVDVLRMTVGGLEYALLSSAADVVRASLCVEVLGGMVDNYVGQYPLGVVSALLHGLGFSLVDLDTWARPHNPWSPEVRHAPVEYRGVWLKDDLAHGEHTTAFRQAVKLLVLGKLLGHHSFGHQLAVLFGQRGLFRGGPIRTLAKAGFWALPWSTGERRRT